MVSFVFPKYRGPTRAAPPPKKAADDNASKPNEDGTKMTEIPIKPASPPVSSAPPAEGPTEIIGPFKILALGNRLGKTEVMKAAKIPQVQENVIMVSVKVVDNELEPKAQKLWGLLQVTGSQQMGILLHPRKR